MRRPLAFLAAAAVPFLVLAGMVADQFRVVANGRSIRVRVVPVDPMSLFQGEYARLGYDFTRMDQDRLKEWKLPDDFRLRKGDRVWIILRRGADGLWSTSGLERSPPSSAAEGTTALRAEVAEFFSRSEGDWGSGGSRPTGPLPRYTTLSLRTGLESFFVPQGEAERLERDTRSGDVTAEISLLPSGRSALRRIFVKGREFAF